MKYKFPYTIFLAERGEPGNNRKRIGPLSSCRRRRRRRFVLGLTFLVAVSWVLARDRGEN